MTEITENKRVSDIKIEGEILPDIENSEWCKYCGVTVGDNHLPLCKSVLAND